MRPIVHAITPGDHYSPRTGSAIPTVVHGLAGAAKRSGDPVHSVLVDRSTYKPRYGSAHIIGYTGAATPTTLERVADVARARVGLPRSASRRAFMPLAAALSNESPSFVLAHNAPTLPQLLAGTAHVPILYAHNDILRTMDTREAKRALASVARIVCVSESLAEITSERLPASLRDRVVVVGNGVDTELFSPAEDEARSASLRVMFLGRMIPDKGADVLVDAAARLGRRDIEIVIVGSAGFDRNAPLTSFEQDLRKRGAESNLSIVFERFVDRAAVPALLRTADIFVVPSRWPDPCPLTVGEAMATGLPIVASRIGGIPEILGDAGLLVEPGSPTALAEAIASLTDDSARRQLGQRARLRAEQHDWSWAWAGLRHVLGEI